MDKTDAQLDAILEAYAEDFPKKLKFERRKSRQDRDTVESIALLWTDRLTGKGRDALRKKVSFKVPDRYRQAPSKPAPVRPMPRKGG